jgi:DNA-binding GntR family transcriptional regulator
VDRLARGVAEGSGPVRTSMDESVEAGAEVTSLAKAVVGIRGMILSGELLPGQKLLQADLAERLNVSRVPIREALSRLQAEGLITHKPNTGFTVVRFSRDELSEVYLMRKLLETELLRTLKFDDIDTARLRQLNRELQGTVPRDASDRYQELNTEFHFTVFSASPLDLVCNEVARLWNMSAYYRSLYLFTEDASHLCAEHDAMIEAILREDTETLIELSDEHRSGTQRIQARLPGLPASR